ncbi:MAG: zinc-dependent alcohol dehydrogenase family protein [Thermodesulfobacteriota bacterium]
MKAMVLQGPGQALVAVELPRPRPAAHQVLVRVRACGVCRTDLHIVDGELPFPGHPVIPGHEIVGIVEEAGTQVRNPRPGTRVGIPWLGGSCGSCRFCAGGRENLCDQARFTGYDLPGGYAEYTVAEASSCLAIPAVYGDIEAAPLLCAGLIGLRSLRMTGDARRIGIYGFGAAAHIVTQIALFQNREVYAFGRPGKTATADFARKLGACWAGGSDETPPHPLDAAIIFAPAGELVLRALRAVDRGGIVVCAGIHMSDIPGFPYRDLWGERRIVSVANLTRQDGIDFFALAPEVPVTTTVTTFPLGDANAALDAIRQGRLHGAAVLTIPG